MIDIISELDITNSDSMKKYVRKTIRRFRELYTITLSFSSSENLSIEDKIPLLSNFLKRSGKDISIWLKTIIENVLDDRLRELTVNDDNDKHTILSTWLSSQNMTTSNRVSPKITKFIKKIKKIIDENTLNTDLSMDLTDSIDYLNSVSTFAFISNILPEATLKIELFKVKMTLREMEDFLKEEKITIKNNIFKHISRLIVTLNINISQINKLLSEALNMNIGDWLVKIEHELSLIQSSRIVEQREVHLNISYQNAKKIWFNKILNSMSTYHLCGIWFRIIFNSECMKYLDIKSKDIQLIKRLNNHYSQFKGLFVRERSWVKYLFKGKKKISEQFNSKDIIGISVCKYWYSSMNVKLNKNMKYILNEIKNLIEKVYQNICSTSQILQK